MDSEYGKSVECIRRAVYCSESESELKKINVDLSLLLSESLNKLSNINLVRPKLYFVRDEDE